MDEPTTCDSGEVPHRPERMDWGRLALRAWLIVLAVVAVIVFIKLFRRGGSGMALAMAAPAVIMASTRRNPKVSDRERGELDQDFLKLWLSRAAIEEPLLTPAEFCEVLNSMFRKDGRAEPFDSPMQMARELKKLGLQSSVRSIPGRSERADGMTWRAMASMKPQSSIRQQEQTDRQRREREALRLVRSGQSVAEVAERTGLHRLAIERALRDAIERQAVIRQHLQSRSGLTSLLRYPDRGPWGQAGYMGNSPGFLIVDLLDYLKPTSVFDPMEGSGTTGEVCADFALDYKGRDLRTGFDLLSGVLPDRLFDLVFWHPPYWPGFRYSNHPNDLSTATSMTDYLDRLHTGLTRLHTLLASEGHLVMLIGDGRKSGVFYSIHADVIQWRVLPLEAILIKEGDHARRARHFRYGPTRFIPTLHEYVLIFKRGGSCTLLSTPV